MKNTMKKTLGPMAGTALIFGLAASVFAHGGPGAGFGGGPGWNGQQEMAGGYGPMTGRGMGTGHMIGGDPVASTETRLED